MRMNPIWKKELVLGARTIKFPMALMCYSMVMTLIAIACLSAAGGSTYYFYTTFSFSTLTMVFMILSFVQLFAVCIIVPVLTAGSIAGERERQTLDLLLTSPMNSRNIVIGKLASSLCSILLFILSSLPAMSIAFIYGGLHGKYLIVFFLGMVVIAFFNGTIGIYCAAHYKKTITAIIMTLLIEVVFYISTFVIVWGFYLWKQMQILATGGSTANIDMGWVPSILFLNPATGFVNAILETYTGESYAYQILSSGMVGRVSQTLIMDAKYWHWISFGAAILVGIGFVALAARKLDAVRKEEKKLKRRAK